MKSENMRLVLSFLAVSALTGVSASAQQIKAMVGTTLYGTASDGQDLSISLGTISTDTVLRIFDDSTTTTATPPSISVGKVTISGSVTSGAKLKVLVTNSTVTDFPNDDRPQDPILQGVVNFGRATGSNPGGLVIADENLRRSTILALSATGDIRGDIEVGRVYRIQATNGNNTGAIHSNITAIAKDEGFGAGQFAINYIVTQDLLAGNVTATGEDDDNDPATLGTAQHRGSIQRVIVTRSDTTLSQGITGNLIAERTDLGIYQPGYEDGDRRGETLIKGIFCTGPIGTANAAVSIQSAWGIGEVKGGAEGTSAPEPVNFYLNVQSNTHGSGNTSPAPAATLTRIRTAGDLSGVISALNLGPSLQTPPGQQCGILCAGTISAAIEIDRFCEGDIVASTFTGITGDCQIKIGEALGTNHQAGLAGSIVAFASNGQLPCAYVGRPDPQEVQPNVFEGPGVFSGSLNPPVNLDAGTSVWFEDGLGTTVGHSVDSVIRAASIGTLKIGVTAIGAGSASNPTSQYHLPRVEAVEIGSLQIREMRSGVVWSGRLEYANGVPVNDTSNDYATITNCQIGCMGSYADVWYTDCSDLRVYWPPNEPVVSATGINLGSVYGEIHTPTLEASHKVRIGRSLGRPSNECACEVAVTESSTTTVPFCTPTRPNQSPRQGEPAEASPRNGTIGSFARIDVSDSITAGTSGHVGQTVINALNPVSSGIGQWLGNVGIDRVGDDIDLSTVNIKPRTQPTAYNAPYYSATSPTIGGGAVGLVPYAVHAEDSTPALTVDNRPTAPTATDPDTYSVAMSYAGSPLTNTNPLIVRFYGAVRADNDFKRPLHVYRSTGAGSDVAITDMTCHFTQTVRRFGTYGDPTPSREIRLVYLNGSTRPLPIGTYSIQTNAIVYDVSSCLPVPTVSPIRCDQTLLTPVDDSPENLPVVRPLRIDLTVYDPSSNPCADNRLVADFDDGSGTGMPDGGVTIDDLLYYLAIFEVGTVDADVDDGTMTGTPDGGVTIDDLLYYLFRFEAGC